MGGYAFFDIDHTLIDGSTGAELTKEGFKTGMVPLSVLLRIPVLYAGYRLGVFDPSVLEKLLLILKGVPDQKLREMARRVFEEGVKEKLYRGGIEAMERERRRGREVVFASSSINYAVKPLAEYFGIKHYICTYIELKDGRATGRLDGIPAFASGKHRRTLDFLIERGADPADCSFYSDSHYDLPLLELVGEPVAVNPDRRLRRKAKARGWRIEDYSTLAAEEKES